MSARGRGGGGRAKLAMPNLSSAGKREESSANGHSGGKQRGGGRGRGRGRGGGGQGGRGRGRGGGRHTQELIQTEGVFSAGLHYEEKKKERVKLEIFDSPRTKPKEELEMAASMRAVQASATKGYAEIWESDEEGDQAELNSFIRDGFISGLRRGRVLPFVVPDEEEKQFHGLMQNEVKEELGQEEDVEMKPLQDLETPSTTRDGDATAVHSIRAANLVKTLINEQRDDLFVIQLPTAIHDLLAKNEEEGEEGQAGSSSASLERGRRVGQLRVTRAGRLVMRVGGRDMDVTQQTSSGSGYYDCAVMLSNVDPTSTGVSSLTNLGDIRHHLVASLNWDEMLAEAKREEQKRLLATVPPKESTESADGESKEALKKKLQRLREDAKRRLLRFPTPKNS